MIDQIPTSALTDPTFRFLQIGANDGLTDDPLNLLVRKHNLTGLLVEPLPDVFARLLQNYADQPQLQFDNSAITSRAGPVTFYRHPRYPQCSGLSVRTRMQRRAAMQEVTVQGITFLDLLRKHHVNSVDLLCVDTEGHDLQIIQSIPWQVIRPKWIYFEHKHIPDHAGQKYLNSLHYLCTSDHNNTLAVSEFH